MYSTQLFIKVEQAATHGSPYAANPKFYQVTTSGEFTLVQALENILGGDLVHYEIIGPGTWVTWTTLTKELKGQQLTLLYHNHPFPHTRAALYGTLDRGTKPTLEANNMQVDFDTNEETDLKVFIHTQIDSLKLAPESTAAGTDSNNVTSCDSLDIEKHMLDEDKLAATNIFSQFCNQNSRLTLDSQTQMKAPVACRNNIPEYTQVVKVLPDKEINSMSDNHDKTTQEQNPLQVFNNVPHFSYMEQDQSTISFNAQRLTSQNIQRLTSQNVQRLSSQTAQSSILSIAKNPSIQTTQTMKSQAIQNLPPQSDCTTKQNNLNNLSSQNPTSNTHTLFVQNSLDSQIVQKNTTLQAMTSPGNRPSHSETDAENVMYVDVSKCQFSEGNMVVSDTDLAASPLFTQAGQAQQINTSSCPRLGDYVSHACIQNVNRHFPNLDPVAASVQCQHSGFVATSPELDGLTSPELQAQHQHHMQQQALLERKMLEMYQLQRLQQVQSFIAATAASNNRTESTSHPDDQQQLWNVLPNVSQVNELQYPTAHHRRSSDELGQNFIHQQLNKTPQSFPLSRASHQQFSHQQSQKFPQPHQQSHCKTQLLTKQPPINHTPKQQSSNVITEHNYHPLSGFQQRQFPEIHLINTSLSQQGNTASQLEEQSSNNMNSNIRSEQNLTVFKPQKPQSVKGEHSNGMPTFVRPQNSLGQSTSTQLPNFELTVRLPQPNSNPMSSASQILINSKNKHNTGSGSSGSPVGRSVKFADSGATFHNSEATFPNSGATFHNSGATFLNSGATFPNSGATFPNSGATFHNSGATLSDSDTIFHNSGAAFHNSGVTAPNGGPTFHNNGATIPNCGTTFLNSGATFHNSGVTVPKSGFTFSSSGAPFHNGGATFHNGGATFHNGGATFHNGGATFPNNVDLQSTHAGTSRTNSVETSRKEFLHDDITVADEEGYNYIDRGHSPEDESPPMSIWPSPATPKRYGYSLATELLHIEGWCPQVNGDTILNSMKIYQSQDGSYIVWKSRRHDNFVITVSHLHKLFHFRVEETQHEAKDRIVYYLFEGGFRSESLLDLLQHYRQNSIRIPMQCTGGTKTYMEHIKLSHPIKPGAKRKNTSRSS